MSPKHLNHGKNESFKTYTHTNIFTVCVKPFVKMYILIVMNSSIEMFLYREFRKNHGTKK